MGTRVVTDNVKFIQEFEDCTNTMHITNSSGGVLIQTINSKDNSQHDFEINKKDWELIKMLMDNFVNTDYKESD